MNAPHGIHKVGYGKSLTMAFLARFNNSFFGISAFLAKFLGISVRLLVFVPSKKKFFASESSFGVSESVESLGLVSLIF